jgi:hypothetical protein
MLSCFGGGGAYSDPRSFAACEMLLLLLEVLRFQPRLSFRRKDDADEGVVGSSGLEISVGVSVFAALANFGALGPVSLAGRAGSVDPSCVVKSPLVIDLGMYECSPLFFGRDDEMNGDTVCLGCLGLLLTGIGFEDSELLPICDEDPDRR